MPSSGVLSIARRTRSQPLAFPRHSPRITQPSKSVVTSAVAGAVAVEGAGLDEAVLLVVRSFGEDTRRPMVVTPSPVLARVMMMLHRRLRKKLWQSTQLLLM